ncbi:hypothetical protein HanRHA438_Chr03g0128591 [Helianthus annuus]|uniref:Uncharacterized protein n=1 Tax=Helianthus annuus TaxID=4232 RepID=A0A9K3NWA2_HELAN|nr:hypothetical protein HanXRQr2_Chr03g0116681 [Helianthus annuus]KAJ0774306.1 hypothetical protein HanOQP8_Chr03g0110031 [Helianthus annuus]KAJ0936231.1 hypothetical protein HanRHA438_Chr03g0128421 [Helianthus annuus]KAJ0936247.1 hypothetical protein HanRHA438_Chr03g0128591 [Helianthus annuus]KAJ0944161.1 hypothetical protein HanPSC8_Chr03g0113111 [Helianthus annuus]
MNCYPAAGSLLHSSAISNSIKVFDEMCKWDRASVEIEIVESTFQRRAEDVPSSVSVQGHHWILDPQYPCQIEIYWCSFLIAFKSEKDTHAIFSEPVNPNEDFAILLYDPQQILMVNVAAV